MITRGSPIANVLTRKPMSTLSILGADDHLRRRVPTVGSSEPGDLGPFDGITHSHLTGRLAAFASPSSI
jgi:hypothetical protein